MILEIQILGGDGTVKASVSGMGSVTLVYNDAYAEGDSIRLAGDAAGPVVAQLEDSIPPVYGWLSAAFRLAVPFAEKKACYSPKSFTGGIHLLTARAATPEETAQHRNLALNPLDSHENSGLYPHASANVETRGESVFAARNAIDGHHVNFSHGSWPYQSWGIGKDDKAEIRVDFGRTVQIDALSVTLRADFPHDNWWKSAQIVFSNGFSFSPVFEKTGAPQTFALPQQKAEWAVMRHMKKDENDPSEFPALTQLAFWGSEAK